MINSNYDSAAADYPSNKGSTKQDYQDTIQRLRSRVTHLQDRLALEETNQHNVPMVLNRTDTSHVQNKIQSMRLNFDLLEEKLGQEISLPDSGRIYVVSGRLQPDSSVPSINMLSQGSLTARGNGQNRLSVLTADRSAGQDSLETVADFRGRNMGADGTHSSSAFIQCVTPRLNSGRESSGHLNQTYLRDGTESQIEAGGDNVNETELQNNSSFIGVSLRSEASTMNPPGFVNSTTQIIKP